MLFLCSDFTTHRRCGKFTADYFEANYGAVPDLDCENRRPTAPGSAIMPWRMRGELTLATEEVSLAVDVATARAAGIWSPALTPFDRHLAPDGPRFVGHVNWLLQQGCHGVAVFGTTSEATSLSVGERIGLLEELVEAGVEPACLMVGTGCAALPDTVKLTAHAAGLGCTRVLMLPPFYYKGVSEQGLFDSYSQVIDRVGRADLQVYFYHFPQLSGVPITAGLIARLLATYPDTIAGLKDSSGDGDNTAELIRRFPDLAIFPGSESLLLAMLEKGGAGCITASANANPGAIRRVWDAFGAGDADVAALQAGIDAMRRVIEAHPLVPALKLIAAHHRADPAWSRVRPPLVALDAAAGDVLLAELADLGFTFSSG